MPELASSRHNVPEPVLNRQQQVLESGNESRASNNGESAGNDGQTEVSEESEEENLLGQDRDETDHQSILGARRPIGREFLS